MADDPVTLVMGDVIASREIADRAAFDRRLRDALRAVNESYAVQIGAGLVPFKGVDEFAGTLVGPGAAYEIVRDIQAGIRPARARYVVGIGLVDVNPDADDVRAMDGPVVHRADESMATLSREGGVFRFDGGTAMVDDLATAAGDLALAVREVWTDRQAEVAGLYRALGSQAAVGDRLGISQQSVSESLAAARYERVHRAEERLNRALATEDAEERSAGR